MNRAVFVDRDGTLIREGARQPVDVKLLPGAVDALKAFRDAGYLVILVSNQPDVGRGVVDPGVAGLIHRTMVHLGVQLDDVFYCYHTPEDHCGCRKPRPGMIRKAVVRHDINLRESWMVGDRDTDLECARLAGTRGVKYHGRWDDVRRRVLGETDSEVVC